MSFDSIRVLLVDDNQADLELLTELLQEIDPQGFEIQCFSVYEDAIRQLEKDRPDVCVVDYRLGPRSGLSLIEEAFDLGVTCPFVLLTGYANRELDIEAMRVGASAFVNKNEIDAVMLERAIRYSVEEPRHRALHKQNEILEALERLWRRPSVSQTSESFQLQTLSQSDADTFNHFAKCFEDLMELAVERQAFKVDHDVSEGLHVMADELGALQASPRDVIEIHYRATQNKSFGATPEKSLAIIEEGNLMALELMGYLASYYRGFARAFRGEHPRAGAAK